MKLAITEITARMRAPVISARDALVERPLLLVTLAAADGARGYGEAAPLERYDGVGLSDVRAALEDCRALLAAGDDAPREELLADASRLAVLPQAVAAIDLALWDLAGRRARQPVWRLLGAGEARPIAVNGTVAAGDRAGAAAEAAALRERGFRCVKVKVGIGDDAGRLAAVRAAAGAETAIRIDANGSWSPAEACAALRALEPVGIELCEEPVRGLEATRELAASTAIRLALDESAAAPGALEHRICDAICLKIARCGGISGTLDAARRARRTGYALYLASTFDGPLGIAAALHAATAIAPELPCGLATLSLFDAPGDPLPARDGEIEIPGGPGLGPRLPAWYERWR